MLHTDCHTEAPRKEGFRVSQAEIEECAAADAARADAQDFAQSINPSQRATPEDVKAKVRELAKRYEPFYIGVRRGV